MSQHYFFDTSALVKYYHVERGTDIVTQIVNDSSNTVVLSKISILEFHSQLALKVRDSANPEFNRSSFYKVCGLLCYDIVSSKFRLIELPNDFIFRATDLIREHGCERNLRQMDAIQLSSFLDYLRLNSDTILVASDKKLLDITQILGFKLLNPDG